MAATGAAPSKEAGMRYMLLIYTDEAKRAEMSEAEAEVNMGEWFAYTEALRSAGAMTAGDALQPTATATSVRDDGNGGPLVTDGPFAETREQLGGFYSLDVADLDEAIEWARKCPAAKVGTVELRPVVEFDQA
jgi:hypothetical protein